jgi:serine/threonine-protein kinase
MGNRTKAQSFVRFFSSSAALMALAVTAAACSAGGGTAIPQGTQSTGRVSSSAFARLSSQSNAAASAAAQGSNPLIYAADAANNAIYVYNNVPNSTPTRVITTGINNPQGITVDSGGNLYVANAATNDVLVYAPGSGTPSRT